MLNDLGDAKGAEREFQEAVTLAPKSPLVYNNRGISLRAHGDWKGAADAFRKAVEADPKNLLAHVNLAKALHDLGDVQGALAAYRKLIELDPKRAPAHRGLAEVLREIGDLPGAVAELRKSIELEPGDAIAHYNLSYALYLVGDTDGCIAAARRTIELDPTFAGAYGNLGGGLYKRGDMAGAVAGARKAVELDPGSAFNQAKLSMFLLDSGDVKGSLDACRKAVELSPGLAVGHHQLAIVLRSQGRFGEAEAAFRRAAELYADIKPSSATLPQQGAGGRKRPWVDEHYQRPGPSVVRQAEEAAAACRIAVALGSPLPAMLAEKEPPKDNAERTLLARACSSIGHNVKAARLFDEALRGRPPMPDDVKRMFLTEAARPAVLAGCGLGGDAAQLNEKDQAHWRQQAMDWLRADLDLWTKCAATGKPEDRKQVQAAMEQWKKDTELHVVGRPEAMAKLLLDEQEAWKKLWKDVEELLRKAQAGP